MIGDHRADIYEVFEAAEVIGDDRADIYAKFPRPRE